MNFFSLSNTIGLPSLPLTVTIVFILDRFSNYFFFLLLLVSCHIYLLDVRLCFTTWMLGIRLDSADDDSDSG